MANGRNKNNKGDSGRDAGGFVALPWTVLDCPAYACLSAHAKALLMEVARQWVRDNNGRLLLSRAYMATRGWKSNDTIAKAKSELIEGGFIFETVKGHRPNKASWYAVTWQRLDKIPGYDTGAAQCFERRAYLKNQPLKKCLTPPGGTGMVPIAPPHGTGRTPTVPPHGVMEAIFTPLSVPPHGHHLEKPSVAVGNGDVLDVVPTSAAPAIFPATGTCIPPIQSESTTGNIATLAKVVTAECDELAVLVGADDGEDF